MPRDEGSESRYRAALALAYVCHSGGNSVLKLLKTMSAEEIWVAPCSRLVNEDMPQVGRPSVCESEVGADRKGQPTQVWRSWGWGSSPMAPAGTRSSSPTCLIRRRGSSSRGRRKSSRLFLPFLGSLSSAPGEPRHTGPARLGTSPAAFAARGVAVISGMALGIDGRSHEAALEAGGMTVAVLGCGADIVYPARHRSLYELIAGKGLILSELPPGTPPAAWTFPHRNRLLAALGDAVVVIEGAPTSGAMQTADQAAGLGRPVFAVPGSIYSDNQRGCNLLVRDGVDSGPRSQHHCGGVPASNKNRERTAVPARTTGRSRAARP